MNGIRVGNMNVCYINLNSIIYNKENNNPDCSVIRGPWNNRVFWRTLFAKRKAFFVNTLFKINYYFFFGVSVHLIEK